MASRLRQRNVLYGGRILGKTNLNAITELSYVGVHKCVDETHPGPPYRSGGPLLISKKTVDLYRAPYNEVYLNPNYYHGRMYIKPITLVDPTPQSLTGWGAIGWNRTYPTHPIYNLGVSIGELKDLPRMVNQTMAGFRALKSLPSKLGGLTIGGALKGAPGGARSAGDAYLYGAFGIKPMLQDLLFLLGMAQKLEAKLAWLKRKQRSSVRAEIELSSSEYSENLPRTISPAGSMDPSMNSAYYAPGQTVNESMPILKSYRSRIWFSAKYELLIPELLPKAFGRLPKWLLYGDLLGLSADPSILYKLIPWSWLLDWFVSLGALLANIYMRARHHWVARYAYVMCEEHFDYAVPGHLTVRTGNVAVAPIGTKKFSGVSHTLYDFKQREVANPYGFGVTFNGISPYQWSILVALGLSRGSKHSSPRP